MTDNFKEKFKNEIEEEIKKFEAQYEKEKHRYSSLGHFCDLGLYNLENNTNFQPEEMSHEMIIRCNKLLERVYKLSLEEE